VAPPSAVTAGLVTVPCVVAPACHQAVVAHDRWPRLPWYRAAGRLELVRVRHYDTCCYHVRHGRAVFVRIADRGYTPLPGRLSRTAAMLPAHGVLLTQRIDGITDGAIARRNADDAGS